MGTFSVEFAVHSPIRNHAHIVLGLVDTGATYTTIPEEILEELGVARLWITTGRLADGFIQQRSLGLAELEYRGVRQTTYVAFGVGADAILLGATALEDFKLAVDPTHERLIPAPVIP